MQLGQVDSPALRELDVRGASPGTRCARKKPSKLHKNLLRVCSGAAGRRGPARAARAGRARGVAWDPLRTQETL